MADEVLADTALMSNNFFLDIAGAPVTMLTSVSGLDVGVEATDMQQTMKDGKITWTRTLGSRQTSGTLTLTRLAPTKSGDDGIWKWFKEVQEKGALQAARKDGSVVMYSSDMQELARYNFSKGWVSKISLDGLDISSSTPLKETISLEFDLLERNS
jgi:phage tail-like protein